MIFISSLVDYNLLLIINLEKKLLKLGIIDYMRLYTWDKQIESLGKHVIKGGAIPTIVNP